MTREAERALLHDYLATSRRLRTAFQRILAKAEPLMPMTAERIDCLGEDDDLVMVAFLKRFEQYEDCLQRLLRTVAQLVELGKVEGLSALDVARRAERFGIVDADLWSDAVRARNALAHQYPLRPEKRVEQINRAWDARGTLEIAWSGITRFVTQQGLIDDPS